MLMGEVPFFKPVQRIVILKYQKERYRKQFFIGVRKALFQVIRKTYVI